MDLEDFDALGARGRTLGCLMGVVTLVPLFTAGIGAFGLWKLNSLPAAKRNPQWHDIYAGCLHTGLWVGIPLLALTIWMLLRFRNAKH